MVYLRTILVPDQVHKQKGQEHALGAQAALQFLHRILQPYDNEEQNLYPSPCVNGLAQINFSRQSVNENNKTQAIRYSEIQDYNLSINV